VQEGDASLTRTLAARSLTTMVWGEAQPAILEGTYRLQGADGKCLAAAATLQAEPCGASAAQVWSVTRTATGMFEVRNLAKAADLVADAGSLRLLPVDGDHLAAISLQRLGEDICVGASAGHGCDARARLQLKAIAADNGSK